MKDNVFDTETESWRTGRMRTPDEVDGREVRRLTFDFDEEGAVYSDTLKPQLSPDVRYDRLDGESIFGDTKPLNVEIGIGNGEFLQHYAIKNPDQNWLGFEVFKKIFRKAAKRAGKVESKNIRVVHFDAAFIVRLLKENSVNAFYVNFPDPWPKKRHNKRRLLKTDFIETMIDRIVPGGYLYMATDHDDYAAEIVENLKPITRLESAFETVYKDELVDYYPTKYYRKFAAHTGVYFFKFKVVK